MKQRWKREYVGFKTVFIFLQMLALYEYHFKNFGALSALACFCQDGSRLSVFDI